MTQSKITYEERIRHIEAVRRVGESILAGRGRSEETALDVLNFVAAFVGQLAPDAGHMYVRLAEDMIARGMSRDRGTVSRALDRLREEGLILPFRRTGRAQRTVDATGVPDPRKTNQRTPNDRSATVWTLPTGLLDHAAGMPPARPNYWTSAEGEAFRRVGAAITAERAEEDRQAARRRAVRSALKRRKLPHDDTSVETELQRLAAEDAAQHAAGNPAYAARNAARSTARNAAENPPQALSDSYSLRSPSSVGVADGLGASGTTALDPGSDGDGGNAGSTNAATTTDPRTDAAGMRLPAEHDAQRRAEPEQESPPAAENPWLRLRAQAEALTQEGRTA